MVSVPVGPWVGEECHTGYLEQKGVREIVSTIKALQC